jgi:DNA-directed RNA polymerase specialized sigma24 family protein
VSHPQAVASGSAAKRSGRIKSLRTALWSYLKRPWTGSRETDSATTSAVETFQIDDRSNVDQIAVEVCQLLQAVPDDCEAPQALVLKLAQRVQDRQESVGAQPASASRANAAADRQFLQNAVLALDRQAREIMLLQLSDGSHYRAIAERLNMPPAEVLRILTSAYAQLRWHTEPVDLPAKS